MKPTLVAALAVHSVVTFCATIGALTILDACAAKFGPFPPPGGREITCGVETACPTGYRCGFAKTGTHATCLWVAHGYDDVLDRMPEGH